MNKKVIGCIAGAAIGDALGSATESKSTSQIKKIWGERVTTFQTPPDDVPARGRKAGQFTDAFSIPFVLTEHLIENNGKATTQVGKEALLAWGDTEYFEPFAGMTTRKVINRMNQEKKLSTWDYIGHLGNKLYVGHYYALSSNGCACKAYPAALINRGDTQKAIRDAVELTMASHDDAYSVSGACAVAAAVSEALQRDTSIFRIVKAAVYGSVEGERLARARADIRTYPGPSVTKRIEMAVDLAVKAKDKESAFEEIRDLIGSGPAVAESVPAAIGLLVSNRGNVMEAVFDAVNIGDETSTIACIVGAIAGCYCGVDQIPKEYVEHVEKANKIDLYQQAEKVEKIWESI